MLIYQHSWSQQGQKKLFWSEVRSYQTEGELLGLHQRKRRREKSIKGSKVRWNTGIFLFGQLSLHAADILDKADNRGKMSILHWKCNSSRLFQSIRSQQKIVRNDSGTLWYFIKGRHILLFLGLRKKTRHFLCPVTELCSAKKKKKKPYINILNSHAH